MKKQVTIVGAAAVGDYIFHVEKLPRNGEIVLIDSVPQPLVAGGCAPNIAAGIAALGQIEPVLCYPVGTDRETAALRQRWETRGITCRLTEAENAESGRSWMFMQDDGTTMCFAYPGAADAVKPCPGELEDWVVIAPVMNAFTTAHLDKAIAQGCRIAVTGIGCPALVPYLQDISVLVINRCECESLCSAAGLDGGGELSRHYPGLLLYVTRGSEGSSLYQAGEETCIPAVQADRLVDFTGAGDSYTAALLSAMLTGSTPEESGRMGAAMASFVVEQFGGQEIFPTWEMLVKRLKEQNLYWI